MLLAVTGLLLVAVSDEMIMYLVGLAVAFEMSFGPEELHVHLLVPPRTGVRRSPRPGAARHFRDLLSCRACREWTVDSRKSGRAARAVVLAFAIPAVLLLEYWVAPLPLTVTVEPASAVRLARDTAYRRCAEFPIPEPITLPGNEPRYAYMSTFHFMPLLNGYSGYFPACTWRGSSG